jgi:membrane fusion protein (multidrug efflux system)
MSQDAPAFEETLKRPARPGARGRPGRTVRQRLRSTLIGSAAIGLFAAGGLYGQYWWTAGRFLVSTDDAYLQADNVVISPRVSGYIASVLVTDNQPVRAGQVLARIDDRDYRAALAAAQAIVAAQEAAIANLTQQVVEQQLLVAEARATIEADKAALAFASQDSTRYLSLSRTGAATSQDAQRSASEYREKQANLDHDNAAVAAADQHVEVLRGQLAEVRATLAEKQAALRQAELNLGYATITAPVDGSVADRTLRVGQYVQAGTQLMGVVPLQAVYVTANYKETQLTHVRAGQPVTIEVDTYPGATVHGVVNSIAPASGQEFALLPPDNATGNFTKIVQRVPVKIAIDPHDPLIGELRPGMSVEPTIDTKGA